MAMAACVDAKGEGAGRGPGPRLVAWLLEAEVRTMAIAVRADAEGGWVAGREPEAGGQRRDAAEGWCRAAFSGTANFGTRKDSERRRSTSGQRTRANFVGGLRGTLFGGYGEASGAVVLAGMSLGEELRAGATSCGVEREGALL